MMIELKEGCPLAADWGLITELLRDSKLENLLGS